MKNFAIILAILSLTSCGFYKRQYTSGWMLSNRHVTRDAVLANEVPPKEISADIDHALNNVAQQPSVPDTIAPQNQSTPNTNLLPNEKEEEQDFYTPKEEYAPRNQNANETYGEDLAKRTFDKRVKNANLGLKMMAIGFGYFILGLALEMNGLANNPEIWIAMSIIGIIAAIVSFMYMFYFTYKSFEIQVNNPDTIFDSRSRSKLIFPAVCSVLLTGWIGLIFALVLVIKSSSRRKRMK